MTICEIWKPIPGYEGYYEVSDQGRVRSIDRIISGENRGSAYSRTFHGRVLLQGSDRYGYSKACLSKDGAKWNAGVHRLVLMAFVGPCPDGMEACHNNGEPTDNRLSNLRYGTKSENRRDTISHGNDFHKLKERCPRGHLLAAPNLDQSLMKRGWRRCLSCKRAADYVGRCLPMYQDRGTATRTIADQNYLKLRPVEVVEGSST